MLVRLGIPIGQPVKYHLFDNLVLCLSHCIFHFLSYSPLDVQFHAAVKTLKKDGVSHRSQITHIYGISHNHQ